MLRKPHKEIGEVWIDHGGNECYYREDGTISVTTVNNEPSLAIQSEKDSCDVNKILLRYKKTGLMSNVRTDQPVYGDFSSCVDYHDTLLKLQQVQESFMDLSADVRRRFSNDPGKLIDFLADEKNRLEAIKLGLVASTLPVEETVPPSEDGVILKKEGG